MSFSLLIKKIRDYQTLYLIAELILFVNFGEFYITFKNMRYETYKKYICLPILDLPVNDE